MPFRILNKQWIDLNLMLACDHNWIAKGITDLYIEMQRAIAIDT